MEFAGFDSLVARGTSPGRRCSAPPVVADLAGILRTAPRAARSAEAPPAPIRSSSLDRDAAAFAPRAQGTRQVTRAAVEFYGPNRAMYLGPFTNPPAYLTGEDPRRAHERPRARGVPVRDHATAERDFGTRSGLTPRSPEAGRSRHSGVPFAHFASRGSSRGAGGPRSARPASTNASPCAPRSQASSPATTAGTRPACRLTPRRSPSTARSSSSTPAGP